MHLLRIAGWDTIFFSSHWCKNLNLTYGSKREWETNQHEFGHLSWNSPNFFLYHEELLVLNEDVVNVAVAIKLTEIAQVMSKKTTQIDRYAYAIHSSTCVYQHSFVHVPNCVVVHILLFGLRLTHCLLCRNLTQNLSKNLVSLCSYFYKHSIFLCRNNLIHLSYCF